MLYHVSQNWRFHEERKTVPAGGTIELDDDAAARYKKSYPFLLKPALQNTMATPEVIRSPKQPKKTLTKGRKSKA